MLEMRPSRIARLLGVMVEMNGEGLSTTLLMQPDPSYSKSPQYD